MTEPVAATNSPDEPPRCDCGLPAATVSNFCSDCLPPCRHGNVLAAVAEIRALHRRQVRMVAYCENCGHNWPCPTIAALDKAGAP